jgi:hypothetical protein
MKVDVAFPPCHNCYITKHQLSELFVSKEGASNGGEADIVLKEAINNAAYFLHSDLRVHWYFL